MAENMTVKVKVDILPFGTMKATERVYFPQPAEPERETIAFPTTTVALDPETADDLPYVLR